jgi:predicted O-methyltransferase YrrM
MRRAFLLLAAAGAAMTIVVVAQRRASSSSLPMPKNDAEKKIVTVLAEMARAKATYLSVPMADGKLLRLLAEAMDAKHVVEIGTSTGYSGLWLCLALQATGGRLITFELDRGRANQARRHFQQAGVEALVTIVEGDAHQNVKRIKDPIDLAFIDADKEAYLDYLNQLLPLVRKGGLVLAHNIDMAPDYVKAVNSNPDLETVFYREGAGMSVTLKKR